MSERLTAKDVRKKFERVNELFGGILTLDRHQPGGNKYVWAVEYKGSKRIFRRMSTVECYAFLVGMEESLTAIEMENCAIVTKSSLFEIQMRGR